MSVAVIAKAILFGSVAMVIRRVGSRRALPLWRLFDYLPLFSYMASIVSAGQAGRPLAARARRLSIEPQQ